MTTPPAALPGRADRITATARRWLGFPTLRPGQHEAVAALLDGHDTLAVMPTGSGKSAIYQLAALLVPGPTVVVSPLIALQRDQVEAIRERVKASGDGTAAMGAAEANSTVSPTRRREALEGFGHGDLEFLFLAPEQLAKPETQEHLAAARPSLFVVDEAHCISSWGHEFRPEYARLGSIVEALGRPRVLALTATAAPPVRAEIVEHLRFRDPAVIVRGFDRPNIRLAVQAFTDAEEKDDALVDRVAGGPGIVYVATRRRAGQLAGRLRQRGVGAVAYHAGLRAAERHEAQRAFMDGEAAVVVATIAFGMGIDKPDVRFVHHADVADSLDSYHQEIGRAGRDGEPAEAVLYYRPEDLGLRRFFAARGQVGLEQFEYVIRAVGEHDGPVPAAELAQATELSPARLEVAANRLEQVGLVKVLPGGEIDQVAGDLDPIAAAEEAAALEESRRRVEQSRVEMVRGYAETRACRREFLLSYFGEPFEGPCGNCDNCLSGLVPAGDGPEGSAGGRAEPFPVNSQVVHDVWGVGLVLRYQGDRLVVLFDQVGYRTLSVETVLERGLLAPAGPEVVAAPRPGRQQGQETPT
jgi:ATP-dependent DNA helicase RecQ